MTPDARRQTPDTLPMPHLLALCTSLSELVFLAGPWPGAAILALLAVQPGLLLGGLAAWLGAIACARLAGYGGTAPLAGVLVLNPLLAGMAVGHLVAPGLACAGAALAVGMLAFLVTVACVHLLRGGGLPALSLPFTIAAAALWLAIGHYRLLPPATADACWLPFAHPGLPAPIDGFLTALGSLVFLPHALVGAALAALIAWRSRILLLCAMTGFATGAAMRVLAGGDWGTVWPAGHSFNAMLATMAVGAVFLVPSWRSLVLGVLAAAASTVAGDALAVWTAWGGAGLPPFTLPFVIATLLVLHTLHAARSPLLALHPGPTPEDTLAEHWATALRFPGTLRTLAPPFSGSWTVWQGHDGPWTHQGPWRHALDFLVCDATGSTHVNDGAHLDDYLAFQRPVLAPVSGQVVAVVDGLPDNPPGGGDPAHPWGNLVVIHDARGFFVELSHFACGTLRVAAGAWVERGQVLGLCGNSGHSPQPHLHVQVQAVAAVGAATLPFSLVAWWDGERYRANHMPRTGGSVEAVAHDPELAAALHLRLDAVLAFAVVRGGRTVGVAHWRVAMGADGGWMLTSGRGRLHFGWHEGTFYVYRCEGPDPWLRLLLCALPRLPLARRAGLAWDDHLPATAAGRSWRTLFAAALGLIHPRCAVLRTRHHLEGPWRIVGTVQGNGIIPSSATAVTLDPQRGITTITVGDTTLTRIVIPTLATAEATHAAA